MSQLKRVSLWAATAAVIAESGVKNLLLSTLVTIGTPATTAGFVYEVVQMRHARLQREAEDRIGGPSRQKSAGSDPGSTAEAAASLPPPSTLDAEAEAVTATDIRHRLDAMLIARSHFVDIYGGNPEAVTPVYQGMARAMMTDDERMFAELDGQRRRDLDAYNADLKAGEARLRTLHAGLALLGPSRIATNAEVGAKAPSNP